MDGSVTADRPLPLYDAMLPAPFGALGVSLGDDALRGLDFLPAPLACRPCDSPLLPAVREQLAAYFRDPHFVFSLPLDLSAGTPFRRRVWAAIAEVPAGVTTTYGRLAGRLGSGARAVGQATGDNPLPILIPCHRVVAAGGLGGFMHAGADFPLVVKRWLLRHEGVAC